MVRPDGPCGPRDPGGDEPTEPSPAPRGRPRGINARGTDTRADGVARPSGESDSIPASAQETGVGLATAFARMIRQAAPFMAAASTLSGSLVLGALAGWWIDERLGTRPWVLLAGTALGLIVGMYAVARVALRPPPGGRN